MPETFGGIKFHPTYEGKMIRYLKSQGWIPEDGSVGFWIVGSEPSLEVIEQFYTHNPDHVLEDETPDVERLAQDLYDACPTPKPAWENLGVTTKGVWKQRAQQQLEEGEPA